MILKLPKVNLIARLEFSKFVVLHLNALCSEVAELVFKRENVKRFTSSADHTFAVQVNMRLLFLNRDKKYKSNDECITSNIKFSLLV